MSEKEQSKSSKKSETTKDLIKTFENLIPLVDSISDSMRGAVFLGLLLTVWFFVWLFFLNSYSLLTASILSGITLIPVLILSRFWWALEELKDLPDIVSEMVDDAKEDVQETVQNLRNNKTKKIGLFGTIKSLFSIRSILSEADDMLGSYISISALINPFWLILGVFSLLAMIMFILIAIILAILLIF
ncbi:MAG: hypothetical protein KAH03_01455 [Cocleimonas sp.]|nr:hypothetical protein [Cocleimonas sp.]